MSFCEVTGDESVGIALDELEVGCPRELTGGGQ